MWMEIRQKVERDKYIYIVLCYHVLQIISHCALITQISNHPNKLQINFIHETHNSCVSIYII